MNADPEDINKNIYFLNKDFTQLNELNTELYIDKQKKFIQKLFPAETRRRVQNQSKMLY